MYKKVVKPFLDYVISFVAIIILSPIFLIIAILIKATSRGSVLFKQQRVGKNKELFNIYKFRSMRIDTPSDAPTHMLQNPEAFITPIGKFLRKSSLDELPQLFNILFGKMSIIGPRPALWNQYDLIEERDKCHANDVKPGITGLAQVSGRDELEISAKAKFDGDYVANITFINDFKLFFKTISSVFKSEGIVEGKQE